MNENDLPTSDLRRRMRELLAIPERDRTDEEWDELNELEIRTAPGNREKPGGEWKSDTVKSRFSSARDASSPAPDSAQAPKSKPRKESRPLKRQHRRTRRPAEPSGDA